MRTLYPPIEAFSSFMFPVSSLHTLYVEEAGNPHGTPIVFLHGGPGGGIDADHRRYFNPKKFRIILFDQRGAGKSTPHASLEENTTWDLIADMERIREHLNIKQWHVFGGSWGSTLALAYAITHPDKVKSLVLRGIFLLQNKEIQWFYQQGTSLVFPEAWEHFIAPIPPSERGDMLSAYAKRLFGQDKEAKKLAAKAWSIWEGTTAKLLPNPDFINKFGDEHFSTAFARIECHYFMNRGFFVKDGWLLDQVSRIKDIPGVIVHGRYDVICPVDNAWHLHKAWPKSKLHIIGDAGHAASEPGIMHALIEATDQLVL